MLRSKFNLSLALSALLAASVASASPVRIDFSGNTPPTLPPTGPGFRISDAGTADTPDVSESFRLGSGVANNADGLNYLRITSSTSSTLGVDVLNFIVVVPSLLISDIGLYDGNPFTEDYFGLRFADGSTNVVNGFAVYHEADVLLASPLLLADITLVDPLLVFSESGFLEGTPGVVGLSNMNLTLLGSAYTTLVEFMAMGAGGADFTARINTAGTNIGADILNRLTIEGSSNGSVETIPEPGTLLLTAAGVVMLLRRRAA